MPKPQPPRQPVPSQQLVNKPPTASAAAVGAVSKQEIKVSSGPIPDPETLERYNRVFPGLAQTIVTSFEAEYRQRHKLESTALEADIEAMRLSNGNTKRGQWLGFVIAMSGLLIGGGLVYLDHDWAGATIGALGLASVLTAYFKNSTPESGNDSTSNEVSKT